MTAKGGKWGGLTRPIPHMIDSGGTPAAAGINGDGESKVVWVMKCFFSGSSRNTLSILSLHMCYVRQLRLPGVGRMLEHDKNMTTTTKTRRVNIERFHKELDKAISNVPHGD